jgi:hypothetical protein
MSLVDYNINIYEEVQQLKDTVTFLKLNMARFEQELKTNINKVKVEPDYSTREFYTIDDIVMKYKISVTTVGKWKKLVPLKTAGRLGKKIRYNKKNVEKWYGQIELLKISNPQLFVVDFKRAS